MSCSYLNDQHLLLVIGEYKSGLIMHAEGVGATGEMEYSEHLCDHFSSDEIPKDPGFYMWEGSMFIDDGQSFMGEPSDPDVRWDGKFRKARPDEVIRWIRKHRQSLNTVIENEVQAVTTDT